MGHYWRLMLFILLMGLWGWCSSAPVSAHHATDNADLNSTGIEPSNVALPNFKSYLLPPNFVAGPVVSRLVLPTDMVILPNGEFLITEKGTGSNEFSRAKVRLVRAGVLQPAPVLTLSVNSFADSGLMSIILDPEFATNHYFYLWYSTGAESLGWTGTTTNRLSRFAFDPDTGTAVAGSETIILDEVSWAMLHNGGGLLFDDEGNLLIATGDAASATIPPESNLAQSMKSLNGKVLRIHPRPEGGYDVPHDNPYAGVSPDIRPEIYAFGLRNPFRMTRRVSDGQIYFVDLGQNTWDEINRLTPTANYGWPYREGNCGEGELPADCIANPGQFTDPLFAYLHPVNQGGCVTALAFYEGETWPAEYQDTLFFADYNNDLIDMTKAITPTQDAIPFATQAGSVVDMEATADGIYALSIYDGVIWYIHYGAGEYAPNAKLTTSHTSGKAPLEVEFTATTDAISPNELTYNWDFGDGSVTTTVIPTVTHTYTADGDYLATLQAVNKQGEKSEILSASIQVYSGALAKIIQSNITRPGGVLYHGGDQLKFSVMRDGGTSGLDPDAPFTWSVLLHHNDHVHFLVAGYVANEVELEIPLEPHEVGAPVWYEVQLQMRTASGQVLSTNYKVLPETVTIQLQSWPGVTTVLVNQTTVYGKVTLIIGQHYTLEAPEQIFYNGSVGKFKNWVVTESWDGAHSAGEAQTITDRQYDLVASVPPMTYIAFYLYDRPAYSGFLPKIGN